MFQAFSSLLHANACVLEKDICLSQIWRLHSANINWKAMRTFGDKDWKWLNNTKQLCGFPLSYLGKKTTWQPKHDKNLELMFSNNLCRMLSEAFI